MKKFKILQHLLASRLIGIIRADNQADAFKLAEACIEGGMTSLEISFTTPGTLEVIKALSERFGDQILIGAGTVLDTETARLAILAGAQFILAPNLNAEVIRLCNRYQVVFMPGVASATEAVQALEAGADIIKIFPSDAYGPAYLKAIGAPLPQAPLMPSGGVTLDNLATWFANGAILVSIGGNITAPGKQGDFAAVTANAWAFVTEASKITAH